MTDVRDRLPLGSGIAVGFSGGVDSAVTALLLREAGYRAHGVFMTVTGLDGRGCGDVADAASAVELAERIDLPLTLVDCSEPYVRHVLDNFRAEYLSGRTPNPCVRCNPLVKFGALPELARRAGVRFNAFATGHYARIERRDDLGRHVLSRGVDRTKDQSYFLFRLSEEILATTVFPLGGFHKRDVRKMAEQRGLPIHDKPDSQDFFGGDYAGLLGAGEREGDIVDLSGRVLGRHGGYWHFTPGQRKGLRVAFSEPLYVIRTEPEHNRVVVGARDEELRRGCVADDAHFILERPRPGALVHGRLRSAQPLREMTVGAERPDGALEVRFAQPQQGVAPGQSLVLYDGDLVIGGGTIRESF